METQNISPSAAGEGPARCERGSQHQTSQETAHCSNQDLQVGVEETQGMTLPEFPSPAAGAGKDDCWGHRPGTSSQWVQGTFSTREGGGTRARPRAGGRASWQRDQERGAMAQPREDGLWLIVSTNKSSSRIQGWREKAARPSPASGRKAARVSGQRMQETPSRCGTWGRTCHAVPISTAEHGLWCPHQPTLRGMEGCTAFPASPLLLSEESSPFPQPSLPIRQERRLCSEASCSPPQVPGLLPGVQDEAGA